MIEDTSHTSLEEGTDDSQEMINFEDMPEILFHAIAGAKHRQNLRVLGNLRNKSVIMLIDGGNTHNFIHKAVVSKFWIASKP